MQYRKEPLAVGETYHIYNRSISALAIFEDVGEFARMRGTIPYYQNGKPRVKLSKQRGSSLGALSPSTSCESGKAPQLVRIVCYCLMPTHLHLILTQLVEDGISRYMALILNSYARYFNTKHRRKGPLWEGRFKDARIATDEQLLHLTRYIHLNPVTAYLVNTPEEWAFSSYREYLAREEDPVCDFKNTVRIDPGSYRRFVEDRIDYQRRLADIKRLLQEEPGEMTDRR